MVERVLRPAGRTTPDPPAQTGATQSGPRRRPPARLSIVAWVLLLMFGVLVVINLAFRQALLGEVDEQVTQTLTREVDEFTLFARLGLDPGTGEQFQDVRALFVSYVQRQSPDDDEILFGFVDEAPGADVPTGRVRQSDEPPHDVSADVTSRGEILASPFATGSVPTPDGELRWEKTRVSTPAGNQNPAGWFVAGYFIDRDRAEITDSTRTLVLLGGLGLMLAALGAWLVSGQILAPVRLVRYAAAEITERDLNRRIPVAGRDDMAALAEQFNAMLDRLQAAFAAQGRFIDAASHELRTPITIIRGNLELMGEDPAERAEVVDLVTAELDRMSRIVEDLLLLAGSERPDFVRPFPVSVLDVTEDVEAGARALADRRWMVEAIGDGTATLDRSRVERAMLHLARNAVQHTADGDEIRIGSAVEGDQVSFWITDTGPGVGTEAQELIFQRFARGTTGGPRVDDTGAGLGLAIVRAIAEAHHGSVRLVSHPGAGATFLVELPREPPVPVS